jgi:hypothetical protein
MNRCLVPAIAFATFCLASTISRPAAAQYPQGTVVVAQPTVIVNNGATYGYRGGGNYAYGGYGYNGAVANYGVVSTYGPAAAAYGPGRYGYGGYASPSAMPGAAPYGAGYSGGYAPYQQMYYQRLYYGLGF